jgi:hypothetical protein
MRKEEIEQAYENWHSGHSIKCLLAKLSAHKPYAYSVVVWRAVGLVQSHSGAINQSDLED